MNKLCIRQCNHTKFFEIPNCTYIKIPIEMLINTNKLEIKRIPIKSKRYKKIIGISITLVSKTNIINILTSNYDSVIIKLLKIINI